MIRINLLAVKAARKREYVNQQLVLFVVLLFGAGVGLFMWYNSMAGVIKDKKDQVESAKQQIEQFKRAIGEVEKYKGLEDMLNRKLKIIEDLIKGKTGPVRVLDRLSQVIPKQVWLTTWEEKDGNVKLEGEALSNKNVAEFMSLLGEPIEEVDQKGESLQPEQRKAAKKLFFTNIRLVETKVKEEKEARQTLVVFKITMNVNYVT